MPAPAKIVVAPAEGAGEIAIVEMWPPNGPLDTTANAGAAAVKGSLIAEARPAAEATSEQPELVG